jgi:uncharacterized membrane protein
MRRILNLNQSSAVFVKLIVLFVGIIPAISYSILFLSNEVGDESAFFHRLIRVSFSIGVLIFVVFLVLLIAEQIQDHWIDIEYRKNQNQKLPLANGKYECQFCGNQKLTENDKTCRVCGKALQ